MKISKGLLKMGSKHLIYGTEGVGKTELASLYPSPLFADTEGSTLSIDVDRVPIRNFNEFVLFCKGVLEDEEAKDYKTIIFDTADWLEGFCIKQILLEDNATSITDSKLYGFGMGDKRIEEFTRNKIIAWLNAILKSGRNVVLTAHSIIKGIDNPIYGRFDTFQLKMSKNFSAILKEWCTDMMFLDFETQIDYKKGIEKNRLKGGRERFIHTIRTPQYEAKNRSGMPERMKFEKGINPYYEFIGIKDEVKDGGK